MGEVLLPLLFHFWGTLRVAAGKQDLEIYRGDTYELTLFYQDSDGNPIDLTNFEARAMWRLTRDADDALIRIDQDSGITINGPNGQLDILLTPTQTKALPLNSVWDIEIEDTSGKITTLLTGGVLSPQEVTR